MEKFCGDSAGKHEGHAKELEALKGPHASTTERLNYVERLLGDSAHKHAKELRVLKDARDKHLKSFEALAAAQGNHATLPERSDYLARCSATRRTSKPEAAGAERPASHAPQVPIRHPDGQRAPRAHPRARGLPREAAGRLRQQALEGDPGAEGCPRGVRRGAPLDVQGPRGLEGPARAPRHRGGAPAVPGADARRLRRALEARRSGEVCVCEPRHLGGAHRIRGEGPRGHHRPRQAPRFHAGARLHRRAHEVPHGEVLRRLGREARGPREGVGGPKGAARLHDRAPQLCREAARGLRAQACQGAQGPEGRPRQAPQKLRSPSDRARQSRHAA